MHIAICDDNVADRKQLERLLKRESDIRIHTTGNLYVDSYGNCQALMDSLIDYDVFFLDITQDDTINGYDAAALLRDAEVTAPIVLCSSTTNYQLISCFLPSIFYLEKPIYPDRLSEQIDNALEMKKQAKPRFEIRGRTKTTYITAEDFLYAEAVNYHEVLVTLYNGTQTDFLDSIENLWHLLAAHPSIIVLRNTYLVNVAYITKITPFRITLTNGTKLYISPGERKELLKCVKNYMF
ncbi:MAG: LytTR family DNA-binding domain-containing protein [Lachnospiraceae bacterium]